MRRALQVDGAAWVALAALLCAGALGVTALCVEGGAPLGNGSVLSADALLGNGSVSPGDAPLALALDWQPMLGLHEPWRLWTCAWVHGSVAHLLVNMAGALVVAFVGWRGRLPLAAATAWFAAWPLVQVLMAAIGAERLAAAMPRYDGLSGVLHAGVVVAGLWLAWPPRPALAPWQGPALAPSRRPSPVPWRRPVLAPWPRERWIGVAIVACTAAKVVSEAPWNLAPRPSAELGIAVAPIAHACGVAAGVLAWAALRLVGRRRGD